MQHRGTGNPCSVDSMRAAALTLPALVTVYQAAPANHSSNALPVLEHALAGGHGHNSGGHPKAPHLSHILGT